MRKSKFQIWRQGLSWKIYHQRYWIAVIGSTLVVCLTTFWWNNIVRFTNANDGLAGWIEAIGVLIAVGIPPWLARREKMQDHKNSQDQKMRDIAGLVWRIGNIASGLPRWNDNRRAGTPLADDVLAQQVGVMSEILGGVDVLSFPDFRMMVTIAGLRSKIAVLADMMKLELGRPRIGSQLFSPLDQTAASEDPERFSAISLQVIKDCHEAQELVRQWIAWGGLPPEPEDNN